MGELLSSANSIPTLSDQVRAALLKKWAEVLSAECRPDATGIPADVLQSIDRSINSETKTYRYVLPTQLLAKFAKPDLDCRSIQAASGLTLPFDARSVCHKVLVPFDKDNYAVLGGSAEPYLNNPLRIPAVVPSSRPQQKDKAGFNDLMRVLDFAQTENAPIESLVGQVLWAIRERLNQVAIIYAIPNRISIDQAIQTVSSFLGTRTGGFRLQLVAVALFASIGLRFGLYAKVVSGNVNAADASTGSAADLECLNSTGKIVLAVEVKDRILELRHVQEKIPAVRAKGIEELLFVVQGGESTSDSKPIADVVARQFNTGQNVYIVEWEPFLRSCLILFGENGRHDFFEGIGSELERQKAEVAHRRTWSELLNAI